MWKIVVGCTDEHSDAALAAAGAAGKKNVARVSAHEGVWVLGDQSEDASTGSIGVSENYWKPKIFSHFDGPYNCSTGQSVTEAQIEQRRWNASAGSGNPAADWCWGRLIQASRDIRHPKLHPYCLECKRPVGCLGHTTCDTGDCENCDPYEVEPDHHGPPPPVFV